MLTSGVLSADHYIPYIFMEWNEIAGKDRENICPELPRLIEELQSAGYSARDANSLGSLPDHCLLKPVTDVLWVHRTAARLWEEEFVVACRFAEAGQRPR